MPLANRLGDFVDVKRSLGNQNYISATGDAAVQGDPACIAAHDLDYHYAIVSLRRGVDAIDRLAHDIAGGVESESVIRAAQIVVDGLGYTDNFDSLFVQLLRDR